MNYSIFVAELGEGNLACFVSDKPTEFNAALAAAKVDPEVDRIDVIEVTGGQVMTHYTAKPGCE